MSTPDDDHDEDAMDKAYARVSTVATGSSETPTGKVTIGCLVIKLKDGDGLAIGPDIEVRLRRGGYGKADLAVMAPKSVKIWRLKDGD